MSIASSRVDTLLQQYGIDPDHGFLLASEPLTRLPEALAQWEDLARDTPKLLAAGRIRQELDVLSQLDHTLLRGEDQINRAVAPGLADGYNECLARILRFRSKHLEYAVSYIHAQSRRDKANPVDIGTGGTPLMKYLKQDEREMRAYLME